MEALASKHKHCFIGKNIIDNVSCYKYVWFILVKNNSYVIITSKKAITNCLRLSNCFGIIELKEMVFFLKYATCLPYFVPRFTFVCLHAI